MTEDGTRWLDDNEAAAWMPLMSVIMWLPGALDAQLRQDAGITHVEYGVLSSLSTATDRTMRLRELARIANSTLSRLSKVVDRLSDRGWVERRPDPEDGRTTLATLTDRGWQKVLDTAPGHVGRVRELVFDRLTRTEVTQLRSIATTLASAVGPDGELTDKAD
ncbi:MarR family transcriptional regulator [Rhodococcoides trifolii]|uniref:MarR family transcriptional regulator n=1 Tax=Rhodococcoides trifolii TaxID=908250 RepID=A0A917G768_9NOCA|nr:MarR family transcriptional regulator [Rhodococcus trifolii]GGG26577.1 MarR family transcriptional regulator [Rhodococcus trifolii]